MRYALMQGNTIATVTDQDAPPDVPGEWVPCSDASPGWTRGGDGSFSPPAAPPPDTSITGIAFKRRLTSPERIAIRTAASANAQVYDYMDLLDSAPVVHLDDKDLIGGLRMLEGAKIIGQGRADAILGAPIRPEERPTGGN